MALIPRATGVVNQASTSILLTDTTGTYDALLRPYGYGAPNRAVADNIVTEIFSTFPDGTAGTTLTLDGTTSPASDWIPKNALFRNLTLAQLGWSGTEFPIGIIQLRYQPWFTTPSGGLVGVTNGSPTVTRQSAQDFTTDFADSYKIRINGVNYTIASGGITTTTITLTENYAGATVLNATAYIGYSVNVGVIIDRPFKVCFMPRFIANRATNCDKSTYTTLSKLLYQYWQVEALHGYGNFDAANTMLIDLGTQCDCFGSIVASGGCSSCV